MVKEGISKVKSAPIRLWVKGRFMGYKRSMRHQEEKEALLQVEGLNSRKETFYYLGKRVAYIYKARTIKKNTRFRVIWGRIARAHGNSGAVRARFARNLPPQAMGGRVLIMLYPQKL